jgi:F-type H+-transporting ATPase subunit epsilon
MAIHCEIVSQDRIVYQGDIDMAVLPGSDGVMGILPKHAPLLTVLKYGIITLRNKKEELHFTVAGGVVEVQPDQITILADAAENVEEIDIQRAEAARKRVEDLLARGVPQDPDSYLRIQAALRRSTLRIDAVRRYRQSQRTRSGQE